MQQACVEVTESQPRGAGDDEALRNLLTLGVTLREASMRVSTHAADYLGLAERGRIAEGAFADFVVVDRELRLKRVFVEGEEIDLADA